MLRRIAILIALSACAALAQDIVTPNLTADGATASYTVEGSANWTTQAYLAGTVTTCTYQVKGSAKTLPQLGLGSTYATPADIPDALFPDLIDISAGGPTLSCLPASDDREHHFRKVIGSIRFKLVDIEGSGGPSVHFKYLPERR